MEKFNIKNTTSASRYNDEIVFLDGVLDVHPELLGQLSHGDIDILKKYYLFQNNEVTDIFLYWSDLIKIDPGIEQQAHELFQKICKLLKIESFGYSSHDN